VLRIEVEPWTEMVKHACAAYPDECVGVMLGLSDGDAKVVRVSLPMENVSRGSQRQRYKLDSGDLLAADVEARRRDLTLIGIYHSHPDCDAYFSRTDLENSCPWYSFVVLSIRDGKFDHANSWLPDADQTKAEKEVLILEEIAVTKQ
jgi:proteasome lid subunit RPN8/RPN11